MAQMQPGLHLPEILEHLFNLLDHTTLKVCRLINSLWNIEACRILRKKSIVFLWERDALRLGMIAKCLENNQENNSQLPYELIHLEVANLDVKELLEILASGRIFTSKLVFNHILATGYSSHNNVEALFQRGSRLESIQFVVGEDETLSGQEEDQRAVIPLKLPEVKEIQLLGGNSQSQLENSRSSEISSDAKYICRIINSSPQLSTLEANFCPEKLLLHIFSHANLANLSVLKLFDLTPYIFKKLQGLVLPKLKTLHAFINPNLIGEDFVASQIIYRVVESFALTLQDLFVSWNFNSIDDNFPTCPKLERLAIKFWSGSLAAFNEEKLPSLTAFHIYDCINEDGPKTLMPHLGVQNFGFECMKGTGVRFGLYSEQDFEEIIMYAMQQFPSITCLDLNLALTTTALRLIISNFPCLEKLLLDSDNDFEESIFTGFGKDQLKKLLLSAADIDSCTRTPCFRDLKELRHLVLARQYEYRFPYDVALTDNGIIYGISKIHGLEFLQFDWELDISLKVVQKHLKQVPKIVINYVDDIQSVDDLFTLIKSMPHIKLNRNSSHIENICSQLQRNTTSSNFQS